MRSRFLFIEDAREAGHTAAPVKLQPRRKHFGATVVDDRGLERTGKNLEGWEGLERKGLAQGMKDQRPRR